jgi:DNA polymerase
MATAPNMNLATEPGTMRTDATVSVVFVMAAAIPAKRGNGLPFALVGFVAKRRESKKQSSRTSDPAGAAGGAGSRARPSARTLRGLEEEAAGCRACDLWRRGTRTVFGEGAGASRLVIVGEQPGDQEDQLGKPFVGPAGRLLDRALGEAGIDRDAVYVTNIVKHFKWEPRGKRRIHQKPNRGEIDACRPWLDAELAVVKPKALLLLGATAAQALLGKDFKVSQRRGEFLESPLAPIVMATVHPSSLLRSPDEETRRRETARFVEDLRKVAERLRG